MSDTNNTKNADDQQKPTVFIIDDDLSVLQALEQLVQSVGLHSECYQSAISFLENFDANRTGCMVIDVCMPIMGGIQLFEELNSRNSKLPVILLTAYGDIPSAVNAMKKGAVDFICKPFSNQYLLEQIQKAINNGEYPKYSKNNLNPGAKELSHREVQVMKLIAEGKMNKQIAHELCISTSTVEFHRARIMKKWVQRILQNL